MNSCVDADVVLALARAQGHDWVDPEVASRIAAAANAAAQAVNAALAASAQCGFELAGVPDLSFTHVLESLADGQP